jgi:DsbC/DsbD-like thiol-disulfide interchange protein
MRGGAFPFGVFLCAAFLMALAAPPGWGQAVERADDASPWVALPQARVRLLGSAPGKNGHTYLAGMELALDAGWKTYWRTPGDAGVPPHFDWTGSRNAAQIRVLYPAPERMVEPAAQTIGYKQSLIFPVEVLAQDPHAPVELNLSVELGLCRDICIPAEGKLSLTLAPAIRGGEAAAILAALERVPRPTSARRGGDPELKGVTASLAGATPRLIVGARFANNSHGGDLFVEAEEEIYVPLPKRLPDAADGTARFEVDLSAAGKLAELKGKLLTLTLVSDAGAGEFIYRMP